MWVLHGCPVVPVDRGDFSGRIRSGYGPFYSPRRQFISARSLTDEDLPCRTGSDFQVVVDIEYFRARSVKLQREFKVCHEQFLAELDLYQGLHPGSFGKRIIPLYSCLKDMSDLILDNSNGHSRLVESMRCLF